MKNIVMMLMITAMLFGCTNVSEDNTSSPMHEDYENEIVDVETILQNGGYENYNGMYIRLVTLEDGKFYYVFLTELNEFTVVNAYTNDNYTTSIQPDEGTYIDQLLEEELARIGLQREVFPYVNHEAIGYSRVDMGEKLLSGESVNIYQKLMADGYQNFEGYYVKEFDYGKVAFNLKQQNVTLALNNETTYFQYNPDFSYHMYSYLDGECTYNKYADISSNCYDVDEAQITEKYERYIEPLLSDLGINIYDLELYRNMMIENGTWSQYQVNRYNTYPNINSSIVSIDEDIATYVYKEFVRRNADIRNTSILVNYKGKDAVFYFEDKTFVYGNSSMVYDWKNEMIRIGKCEYDFKSNKECSDKEIEDAKNLRYIFQAILDDYGLLKKELHIYANSRRIYDKTLGGYKNVE